MMGGRKITHSNRTDGKHRGESESWILTKMDSCSERKEMGIIKILPKD